MADALVSFVLEQLATVIKDKIQQEVGLVVGVQKEIEKLTTSFKAIQAVLNDAEQRQIKDALVKMWYEEFKEVAYDIGDVLDKWSTEILRSQMDGVDDNTTVIADKSKVFFSNLCYLCSCFSQKKSELVLRHDIGSRIQEITTKLELIESNKNKFRLTRIKSKEDAPRPIETSSVIDILEVSGRDMDKQTIMSKLLGECSSTRNHHPIIISIVGMGGLGKTTLAQLVFNDDRVKTHFNQTMWVCVSDSFDQIAIAKAIIEETGLVVPNSSNWNGLHNQLCESMKGKRYLLVLDDVWTYDQTKWDALMISFKRGAQGSCILVTTRKLDIAEKIKTTCMHHLRPLSDEDCWLLLSRLANFEGRTEEDYDSLKETGTKIAMKCKGLPLAAKTLGGLMHFKDDWQNILESKIWELEDDEKSGLRSALLLSYYDLPTPLRECFTYCAVFPKDHEIEKGVLIKMWMAHGFLSTRGKKQESLEKIGEDCFNKLVMRSFFQDIQRDENGIIISCKMHDVIHDFALYLTNDEYYTLDPNNKTYSLNNKTRHFTLFWDEQVEPSFSINEAKKLRSVIVLKNYSTWNFPYKLLSCLRVLDLTDSSIEYLPNEINELIHLRYIDLSYNSNLRELPEAMSNLYNLQSLNLFSCQNIHKLPRNMCKIINLRHLDLLHTRSLMYLPRGFGKLSSLRTLNKFVVSGVDGVSEGCEISELKHLNLIEGELHICGIRKVKTFKEACEAELKEKRYLQTLHLEFKHVSLDRMRASEFEDPKYGQVPLEPLLVERMGNILEGLQPPPNLKKLNIFNYQGSKFASWMVDASLFTHLVELRLRGFQRCTELPALGKLPSLKLLRLSYFPNVRKIGRECLGIYINGVWSNLHVAFPKLEELNIFGMDNLELFDLGVDESVQDIVMPCLVKLSIQNCAKLKQLLALTKLPCLEDLEIGGFDVMTNIGAEFFGIARSIGGVDVNTIIFPTLKKLSFRSMKNLEELQLGMNVHEDNSDILITPCIQSININWCPKLKVRPSHLSRTTTVRELCIRRCPELTWWTIAPNSTPTFPAMLPLIEELTICDDTGVFSTSLSFFPNLKSLKILDPPSSIYPQGLSELKSLQYLEVINLCPFCMGVAEQVQHLTSLQEFRFNNCDTEHQEQLRRIKSHIPNIFVDNQKLE